MSETVEPAASPLCGYLVGAIFLTPDASGYSIQEAADAAVKEYGDINPFRLMSKATRGDLGAQRELSKLAVAVAFASDVNPYGVITEGLVVARMAALQGTVDDKALVAAILCLATHWAPLDEIHSLTGEALAWIEIIAESDAPEADGNSKLLTAFAHREDPEALEWAKFFHDQILEAEGPE